MDTQYGMPSDSLHRYNAWHRNIGILLALLLLLLPWLFGIGPNCRECLGLNTQAAAPAALPAPTVVPQPQAAPEVASAPAPAPAPDPVPSANVYFDVNRTNLPVNVADTMTAVVAYLQTHPTAQAVLSGFHDPRGDRTANEELALNRARAVRTYLGQVGIPEARVVMQRPQETTGTGSLDEARRVEVTIKTE